jgi:hypothetical protein
MVQLIRHINSRELCFMSTFIAIGAATRIVLGRLALEMPTPMYGILIKVGLTETLTFISGFHLWACCWFGILLELSQYCYLFGQRY